MKHLGTILNGRYELRATLGANRPLVACVGHDLNLDRPVAIKVLNILRQDQSAEVRKARLTRFRRLVREAARVEHPNWSRVYDMGLSPELKQPYLVCELLEGHTLAVELAEEGPMTPQRALGLLTGALRALACAHGKGLVHGDLTPDSLLIAPTESGEERLVILDHGLAGCVGSDEYVVDVGRLSGAPAYLPPETIERQQATAASDVYQMALVLVEMLTGGPLADGRHALQRLTCHAHGDLELPRDLVDGPLGGPVGRALLHAPELRPADAGQWLEALSRAPWEVMQPVDPGRGRIDMETVSRDLLLGHDAFVEDLDPAVDLLALAGVVEARGLRQVTLRSRDVKRVRLRAAILSDDVMLQVHREGGDPLDPYVLPMVPHLGLYLFEQELELAAGTPDHPTLTAIALDGLEGAVLLEVEPLDIFPSARHLPAPAPARGVYQVTDLGVSLYVAPEHVVVSVASYDTGEPLAGCQVSMWQTSGESHTLGRTAPDGLLVLRDLPLAHDALGAILFLITDPNWEDRVVLPVSVEALHKMRQTEGVKAVLGRLVGGRTEAVRVVKARV